MIKYPTNCTLITHGEIKIAPERKGTERYSDSDLAELVSSIKTHGLLQPPVLDAENNLIAGFHRTKALKLLGMKQIPIIYREQMDETLRRELEIEENLRVKGLPWQDRVLQIAELHALYQSKNVKLNKTWRIEDTGKLMDCSTAHISNNLLLARYLSQRDQEILGAKSPSAAMAVLTKRRELEAQKVKAERSGVIKTVKSKTNNHKGTKIKAGFLDEEDKGDNNFFKVISHKKDKPENIIPNDNIDAPVIALSDHFFLGDCIDIMTRFPDEFFDHIVTDPPYGIDMANLRMANLADVEEEHDVAENLEFLPQLLESCYRVLKDQGYMIFWYDLEHHTFLQTTASNVGFSPVPWPIVWCKTHQCRNNAPGFNPTKATEVAMVLRKGNATLLKPWTKNYFLADGSVERKLYNNAFAKPAEAWKFLLTPIALKGQKILDPCAGEMSSIRTFINMGIEPFGIELKEDHFTRGLNGIQQTYTQLLGNCVFE